MPSKEEMLLLEPFLGLNVDQIVVPSSPEQFAAAVAAIQAAGAAGFDTETKPVFTRGTVNEGPDLVQFATEQRAYLFQLHRSEGRPFLQELLLADHVMKIGFDLTSDRALLKRKLGIETRGIIDLSGAFRKRGYRNTMGVKSAVALVLNRNFQKSKHVTTSNWAAHTLSPRQICYAANDAYAALMVWQALGRPGPEKASRRR